MMIIIMLSHLLPPEFSLQLPSLLHVSRLELHKKRVPWK